MAEELPAKRPSVIVLDPLEIISRLLAGTLLIPVPGGRMLVSPLALVVVGAGCIVLLEIFGNPGPLTAYSSEWWGALLFNSIFVLYPVLAVLGFIRSVIPHRVTRRVLACVLLALGPVTIATLALLTVSTS